MRFAVLHNSDKIKNLARLHRRLNRVCYGGELSEEIVFDIANVHKRNENTAAVFRVYPTKELKPQIIFDWNLTDVDFSLFETAKQEIRAAATVMLHEMAHQYCYENGIPDTVHGEEWKAVARAHGLEDPNEAEQLNIAGEFAIINFTWR